MLALVLALAAAALHVGLGPQTPQINIRWSESASEADRTHAERELQLSAGMWMEGLNLDLRALWTARVNTSRESCRIRW